MTIGATRTAQAAVQQQPPTSSANGTHEIRIGAVLGTVESTPRTRVITMDCNYQYGRYMSRVIIGVGGATMSAIQTSTHTRIHAGGERATDPLVVTIHEFNEHTTSRDLDAAVQQIVDLLRDPNAQRENMKRQMAARDLDTPPARTPLAPPAPPAPPAPLAPPANGDDDRALVALVESLLPADGTPVFHSSFGVTFIARTGAVFVHYTHGISMAHFFGTHTRHFVQANRHEYGKTTVARRVGFDTPEDAAAAAAAALSPLLTGDMFPPLMPLPPLPSPTHARMVQRIGQSDDEFILSVVDLILPASGEFVLYSKVGDAFLARVGVTFNAMTPMRSWFLQRSNQFHEIVIDSKTAKVARRAPPQAPAAAAAPSPPQAAAAASPIISVIRRALAVAQSTPTTSTPAVAPNPATAATAAATAAAEVNAVNALVAVLSNAPPFRMSTLDVAFFSHHLESWVDYTHSRASIDAVVRAHRDVFALSNDRDRDPYVSLVGAVIRDPLAEGYDYTLDTTGMEFEYAPSPTDH
jgi:hypothetical protein